jgi:hypothetical protein
MSTNGCSCYQSVHSEVSIEFADYTPEIGTLTCLATVRKILQHVIVVLITAAGFIGNRSIEPYRLLALR